ncbi:unnamed protein product [Oncorhynchus mykiss]|uniref:RING-type domain-containing protein n=1 Tax=Oncorhynchus mykiss TaxID=8022 RepID=A0A061ACX7_ONCMY|nr:unnamed protein product [Oncorhynchus mykiss]
METHNLSCAICLDRFKVPVTIPCGHTFCRDCITAHWDTKSKSDIGPHCPICNEKFPTRPILKRNVSLSVLAEATANSAGAFGRDTVPVMRGDMARATPLILCDRHKKPLVYYCRKDNMCVCCECAISECKNHEKVLVEAEKENREVSVRQTVSGSYVLVTVTEMNKNKICHNPIGCL